MATLSRELRKALERVVLSARVEAEAGARKALDQLAVAHHEPWPTMTSDQQKLRRRLRARGRQLGDRLEDRGKQGIEHLVAECAYEQWHRMLFARFLAECGLLIEPASGVPVSVDECKELARERGLDWIILASAFAQGMLPQIFRADDAVLEITLPAEHRQPLEQLLISLSANTFLADDSLGWVYQFWRSEEKDRVNESEQKIGADELSAVTQLFTDDYMVEFLIHNTLGAWWVGRRFPDGVESASEEQARAAVALPGVDWKYLRLVQNKTDNWIPAAGTFDRWPNAARDLRVLDPCMGSGHFLVSALPVLVAMRTLEENLPVESTCTSVLRDNLFGLEIDLRCTQIGAFNLALSAWKLAGWQRLPPLNVACTGLSLNARREDWVLLAGDDENARRGMEQLYELFAQAPVLGSLINPHWLRGGLFVKAFHELQPLLDNALRDEGDETGHQLVVTAQGVAKAAEILADKFTLVATNVPYLGRGKQHESLQAFCDTNYPEAKADLATCFVQRSLDFCAPGSTAALVTPQAWLFLNAYRKMRRVLLDNQTWEFVVRLGARAFEAISGEVVNVSLVGLTATKPTERGTFIGLDVSEIGLPGKLTALQSDPFVTLHQRVQIENPDARIVFNETSRGALLSEYAFTGTGMQTFDLPRFIVKFWEIQIHSDIWMPSQSTVESTLRFGGLSDAVRWENGRGDLFRYMEALAEQGYRSGIWRAGSQFWGQLGVLVSLMGDLPCTVYLGTPFNQNAGVLVPKSPEDLLPIWCFCESGQMSELVRSVDQSLKVTNGTLGKVRFDLAHWQGIAADKYPAGLPKPRSNDPTQWLFSGTPEESEQPLHVAIARLLGYRWPRQTGASFSDCPALGSDGLESFGDDDGVVCIPAIKGEQPAAERLGAVLSAAFGSGWSASKLDELLAEVGYAGKTLDDWLRNGFFEQHCELFHQRPFVWHLWDGRRDGFCALVNYHKLTRANLEKLTYAYLGDWIRRQEAAAGAGEAGSEARLVAAKQLQGELKKILEGDSPYDIFVRWKPLSDQVIGWAPDLNDGVRINIRPFMAAADVGKKGAGIVRAKPNIKWEKDRGKEPPRSKDEFPWLWGWDDKTDDFAGGSTFDGNRWNDLHYSREFKMAARRQKGLA